jgi:hypothetical protein
LSPRKNFSVKLFPDEKFAPSGISFMMLMTCRDERYKNSVNIYSKSARVQKKVFFSYAKHIFQRHLLNKQSNKIRSIKAKKCTNMDL